MNTNEIPTEISWIENGRRHIKCGYGSNLSDYLRSKKIKSKWHADTKTWSVDQTNEQIIPRLIAYAQGQAATAQIQTGQTQDLHFFTIEYKYSSTREAAKKRGCRWNADRKAWYTSNETIYQEMLAIGGVQAA